VPQKSVETSSSVSTSVDDSRAKPVTTVSIARPVMPVVIAPTQITTPTSDGAVETAVIPPDTPDASGTTPPVSSHKGQGGPSGTQGTAPAPTQPTPPATDAHVSHIVTQQITSIGGTITVRQDKDQLTVIDITPTNGFEAHQTGHYGHGVLVTFTSTSHQSDISVIVYHGKIIPKVTEQTQTHGESAPTTTTEPSASGD
jgi:uncharacterized alkaline shock family protein YloU